MTPDAVDRRLAEIRDEIRVMAHRARSRAVGYVIFTAQWFLLACLAPLAPAIFPVACFFVVAFALLGAREQRFADGIEVEFGVRNA